MEAPNWKSFNVSRETLDDLEVFSQLVKKWSPKINLVSKGDLNNLADRHIWDSAQVFPYVINASSWIDLGSGGGFPGIVAAILGKHQNPSMKTTLIESDVRKCAFLRTAGRELDLNINVLTKRIEDAADLKGDVISARALAAVDTLLLWALPLAHKDTKFIFLKGQNWSAEIDEAKHKWSFDLVAHSSHTNPNARLLELMNVRHK